MAFRNAEPSIQTIGLTGGLASGKSTVAGLLREAGFEVVDADRLVADLYRPEGAGADAVRELFGAEALTAEGAVNHPVVAARVFADEAARHALEARIHPLVRDGFRRIAEQATGPVVLEATLLVEAGFAEDFDTVITVEADPEVRLRRAIARGLPEAEARARLRAQGTGEERRAAADRVIDNCGTLEDLKQRVRELVAELRGAAG